MTKILSIDWDYFFPDHSAYDWGAHESQWLFYEIIWHARCSAINIITGADMLEEYVPSIPDNFWDMVANKPKVVVSDSHLSIWKFLDKSKVYNLDAHHDCGYQPIDNIDCSNWGQWGLLTDRIKELHVVYPSWRKESPEPDSIQKPTSIRYNLPRKQKFDLIFVCRSSCWTPPWHDTAFDSFLNKSMLKARKLDDLVKKQRGISLHQAMDMRDRFRTLQATQAAHVQSV